MSQREHKEPLSYHVPRLDQSVHQWDQRVGLGGEIIEQYVFSMEPKVQKYQTWVCLLWRLTIARGRVRTQDCSQRESWQSHLLGVPVRSHQPQTQEQNKGTARSHPTSLFLFLSLKPQKR